MDKTPIELADIVASGTLPLSPDGTAEVRLPAPGATGYLWNAETEGPLHAVTAWDTTQTSEEEDGEVAIGGSPDVILTVRRTGPGAASMKVSFHRPWEGRPLRSHRFEVA